MNQSKIRVGVLGAGYWGPNLIRNVAEGKASELAAVCDLNAEALAPLREKYPTTRFFTDYEEMLREASVEAVVIASPASLHAEHARLALSHGKAVLVEKPLATSSLEAAALAAEADRRGLVLMVGHTFLYNDMVCRVREIIASGELGDLYYLYGQRLNLGQVRRDVDVLWNLAPHDVSIANFFVGGLPEHAQATGLSYVRPRAGIADVAFFNLFYPHGRVAHFHISWLDPLKVRQTVVVGSHKMLVYDDMNREQPIQIFDKRVEKDFLKPFADFQEFTTRIRAGDVTTPAVVLREPLAVEIEHFARCVREGKHPLTDGRHGAEVVLILEALTRSMKEGGIQIPLDFSVLFNNPTLA